MTAARATQRRCATALLAALVAFAAGAAAQPDATPSPSATPISSASPASPSPLPSGGLPLPPVSSPVATYGPIPLATQTPAPVTLAAASYIVPLGHIARIPVVSPPSGILTLTLSDPNVASAVFNGIDRTIDATGLHPGTAALTASDQYGQTATVSITVQPYAGRAASSTQVTITGDPASADFVAEMAAQAALRVAYPVQGATVAAPSIGVADAHTLEADNTTVVHVPVSMTGAGLYPYAQTVAVSVVNLAQPHVDPKFLLVSDFPETITEDGTLFYADVNYDEPARLLYYHYADRGAPLRRVTVKVQNNGLVSSLIQLTAGIAGPDPNVLAVGHASTLRFLKQEANDEGQIFEIPPHATLNVIEQLLPPVSLVSGLMAVRVVEGDGVRIAVVVQDASDSPVEPISDTLLSSVVHHSRGVYEVPDFSYDEAYTVGDDPTVLHIGKLPLPNLVQGEVLGGDYGVKQSATVTLLNTGDADANVGMWLQPRGGRATATFIIDGDLVEMKATDPGRFALVRTFPVPAHGFRRVEIVTMPEGGSSYPVNVLFSSNAPN